MLRRWWTDKYRLPWTPNNISDLTLLDLLTEFYEDLFEKDKNALYDASRGEDGEIVFEETGDELFDKWEKELAMGLEPDLLEGLPEEERQKLLEEQVAAKKAKQQILEVIGIDERFDEALRKNPMYATKTAGEVRGLSNLDLLGEGK